jgi:hypothetical protein
MIETPKPTDRISSFSVWTSDTQNLKLSFPI